LTQAYGQKPYRYATLPWFKKSSNDCIAARTIKMYLAPTMLIFVEPLFDDN
jgi:hypothetical protein